MALPDVLMRIATLQGAFQPRAAAPPALQGTVTGAATTGLPANAFAAQLQSAQGAGLLAFSATPAQGGTPAGLAALNLAGAEVGVAEQPPGSNDAPRIAQFRQATAGSGVGPWCAYFVSWAAREAGAPLGDQGQGFGRVDDVWAWAQRTGKAQPAAAGPPQPGDLIVWDEHIGIVESVLPDGGIQTVEGNSSDQVSRRVHDATGGGAIGYVRLG
jgi:CHAP domain